MPRKMRYLSERKNGDYRYVRDFPSKLLRAIPKHHGLVHLVQLLVHCRSRLRLEASATYPLRLEVQLS